jgi:hypothetical protein
MAMRIVVCALPTTDRKRLRLEKTIKDLRAQLKQLRADGIALKERIPSGDTRAEKSLRTRLINQIAKIKAEMQLLRVKLDKAKAAHAELDTDTDEVPAAPKFDVPQDYEGFAKDWDVPDTLTEKLLAALGASDKAKNDVLMLLHRHFNSRLFDNRLKRIPVSLYPDTARTRLLGVFRHGSGGTTDTIGINAKLFRDKSLIGQMITVLVHEQCHQAVRQINNEIDVVAGGHGSLWRSWMRKCGLPPDRYASQDTGKTAEEVKQQIMEQKKAQQNTELVRKEAKSIGVESSGPFVPGSVVAFRAGAELIYGVFWSQSLIKGKQMTVIAQVDEHDAVSSTKGWHLDKSRLPIIIVDEDNPRAVSIRKNPAYRVLLAHLNQKSSGEWRGGLF